MVPGELETGFRLAGVETVAADDGDEAAAALREIVASGSAGLVAVYEPFLSGMPAGERDRLESSLSPVVVPIPGGLETRDEESHRARISAMLSRAVGYHVTFGAKGEQ